MKQIKLKGLALFLLLCLAFTSQRPVFSLPLPGGRTWDQAHDAGLIDWSGPVQYAYISHRDNTSTAPEEGSVFCGGGCDEWVTFINDGGSVSGTLAGNVTNFKVLVAASHDSAVGTAILQACSSSQSLDLYLGSGKGLPGFVGFDLDVPAGCSSWSLKATNGYVYFHSVNADYTSLFATNTPIPPTFTPVPSATFTATPTKTSTLVPTNTSTVTLTATPTSSFTPTLTFTPTPSFTPTQTPSPTPTFTFTPSPTSTFTSTATATPLPPVISMASILCDRWGNNGWCVENARLAISAYDPQGFPLTITGNAGQPFNCGSDCVVALPEGIGTAIFAVTSSSGRTASGSLDWKYDASLPTSDLQMNGTFGANGWYVSNVNINPLGTDAVSGLASQEISVNGGVWQSSATLSDGIYQVQSRSVDNAGWETYSLIQIIQVDTIKPDLQIISTGEQGGGGYFRSIVKVSLVGSDSGSGVSQVKYTLDGGEWVNADSLTISADGSYCLEAQAIDKAGNQTSKNIVIRIDTISPIARFIMPPVNAITSVQGAISLGGDVSDVGSGVEHVELSLDEGKTWKTLPLVNEIWRYDWITTSIPNGQYRILARGWDIAGNVQEPPTRTTLMVENQPPSISIRESWFVWEAGWLQLEEKDGSPLESVSIIIRDPKERWDDMVWSYTRDKVPAEINWDGHFAGGVLAPVGEYEVIATARDIYGRQASDRGTIVIPLVPVSATPTVTATPSPMPSRTPGPTPTIAPTQTAVTVIPTATPQPVASPMKRPLVFWPAVGLMGLLLALASASLSDHRPQAIRRLIKTIDHIVAQNKMGDDK